MTTTRTLCQPYAILGSVAVSDTFTVTATDNVANQAVSQAVLVLQDTVPPTPTLTIPDVVPPIFEVKWGGIDLANNVGAVGSGIRSYNVQYRVGLTGTWFSLMTDTTELHYPLPFVGTPGEAYYFQLQATDKVSNTLPILDFGLPILDWEVTIQNPKSKI